MPGIVFCVRERSIRINSGRGKRGTTAATGRETHGFQQKGWDGCHATLYSIWLDRTLRSNVGTATPGVNVARKRWGDCCIIIRPIEDSDRDVQSPTTKV